MTDDQATGAEAPGSDAADDSSLESQSLLADVPADAADAKESAEETDGQGEEIDLKANKAPEKPADNGLILGKFKDQAALEKAYGALETKLKGKVPTAPEKYDLIEPMKKAGWNPLDPEVEENKASYAEFEKAIRERGFSQEQLTYMFEYGRAVIDEQVKALGPVTDRAAELASLKEEWGEKFEPRSIEVSKWAVANLPPDVLNKPLASTREGMKLLAKLSDQSKGASPITDSERAPAFDAAEAQIAIKNLMDNPDYWKQNSAGDALRTKVYNLHARIGRAK